MRTGTLRHFLCAASVVLLLASALVACDGEANPEAFEGPDEDVLEQLRAIGYVSGTEPARPEKGVVHLDPGRVQPGLNLFTSGHAPVALLMDLQGRVLHEWRAEFAELFPDHPDARSGVREDQNFWRHAQLLSDGSLIGIWNTYGIFKLDRDSRVLWSHANRAHHDFGISASGDIVHLSAENTSLPELVESRVADDLILVLDPQGNEKSRLRLSDALRGADWIRLRNDFWKREQTRRTHIAPTAIFDLFHTNAIWLLTPDEARRLGKPFGAGQALLSMAHLDTIATVDLERGSVTWWQTGPFALQHQPRVTSDGKIVLFNNFETPTRSTVQILDPHSGRVSWEYGGPKEDPLNSRTSSSAEMLPNGNILIVESTPGRVLEVTRDKEIVWNFRSPYRTGNSGETVASVFHLDRVPGPRPEWLKALPAH